MTTPRKIGFVGWNPFQLIHVRDILTAMPDACFILEKRRGHLNDFAESLLNDPQVAVVPFEPHQVPALDGVFDVMVCQTPFAGMEKFSRTRIAMVQYSYAKEPHTYGAWRAFADLNLAYGPYGASKMSHYSPAIAVGNPRYDITRHPAYAAAARGKVLAGMDPGKKTILYAPTWGTLSSIDRYLQSIIPLGEKYNLLLKMHHLTEIEEAGRKGSIGRTSIKHFGANDDINELICAADAVITDYSGAIFDALFLERPAILLSSDAAALMGPKLDRHSVELLRREELGIQVYAPQDVARTVDHVIDNLSGYVSKVSAVRKDFFVTEPGATKRTVDALLALADGDIPPPSQLQLYVREDIRELFHLRNRK
jgi:hypothetical protein